MKNTLIALITIILLAVSSVAFAEECPLCDVAKEGNLSEVKRLLDNGVDVNATKNGWTALMMATMFGHSKVVKVLLDNGANADYEDQKGLSALALAEFYSQSEITELLIDNGAVDNEAIECPLCIAAARGYLSKVKRLLDDGANVNDVESIKSHTFTALMMASTNGKNEIAKILLEYGADVNYKNNNGVTALMMAALKNERNIIKLLLENGAGVNYKNKNGVTALSAAAALDKNEVAKILLKCGANPDIKNNAGYNTWDLAEDKPILLAILEQNLNDVVQGREFLPCDKAVANKQNKNSELTDGIEARKFPRQNNSAEYVFENIWQTVVYIETYKAQGSGVIIKPNLVATNCHVVENIINIEVYKAEKRRTNRKISYNAKIIKQDDANDFCLLSVEGLQGVPATVRKYDTINIGEDVYGLGAPRGLDLSLSKGLVSQLRKEGNKRLIQTDTAISPGSSGGGLFDSDGNLIGILTEKIVDDGVEGLGFAIPADLAL